MGAQLSFMDAVGAAGWCQRWDAGSHSWRHRSEGGFDAGRYAVGFVPEVEARAFIVTHHYSHTYPAAARRVGLFDAGVLVGVAIFGIPAQRAVLASAFPGLEPYIESLELSRFVLLDEVPANAESWFLGRCWTELLAVGVRGVVSFSDPLPRSTASGLVFPGHVGTIYQATNALYTGRGAADTLTVLPDGTSLPRRAQSKVRARDKGSVYVVRRLVALGAPELAPEADSAAWLTSALDTIGARRLRHPGCHRYLFPLGTNARRRALVDIGYVRHAYPKLAAA